ncbi:MAG: TIGR03546 family protein [Nitrospina sp.]|jgi:uncharacterized protein (TIGR03546 family)|nr:TIGR03546 family protein [Nitrospina sp.]MBT6717090.1 TIGR03546 family protein [Nitrospina sp.]
MIRQVLKIFKALNSDEKPWQLSLGLAFGGIIGLMPLWTPHNIFLLFLAFIINLNFALLLVGFFFFSGIAYILDPLFHEIGLAVLTAEGMQDFWNGLFSNPIFLFDRLNNTLVMGSLLFSLTASVPLFFLFNLLVRKYRQHLQGLFDKIPLLKSLKLAKIYDTVSGGGR